MRNRRDLKHWLTRYAETLRTGLSLTGVATRNTSPNLTPHHVDPSHLTPLPPPRRRGILNTSLSLGASACAQRSLIPPPLRSRQGGYFRPVLINEAGDISDHLPFSPTLQDQQAYLSPLETNSAHQSKQSLTPRNSQVQSTESLGPQIPPRRRVGSDRSLIPPPLQPRQGCHLRPRLEAEKGGSSDHSPNLQDHQVYLRSLETDTSHRSKHPLIPSYPQPRNPFEPQVSTDRRINTEHLSTLSTQDQEVGYGVLPRSPKISYNSERSIISPCDKQEAQDHKSSYLTNTRDNPGSGHRSNQSIIPHNPHLQPRNSFEPQVSTNRSVGTKPTHISPNPQVQPKDSFELQVSTKKSVGAEHSLILNPQDQELGNEGFPATRIKGSISLPYQNQQEQDHKPSSPANIHDNQATSLLSTTPQGQEHLDRKPSFCPRVQDNPVNPQTSNPSGTHEKPANERTLPTSSQNNSINSQIPPTPRIEQQQKRIRRRSIKIASSSSVPRIRQQRRLSSQGSVKPRENIELVRSSFNQQSRRLTKSNPRRSLTSRASTGLASSSSVPKVRQEPGPSLEGSASESTSSQVCTEPANLSIPQFHEQPKLSPQGKIIPRDSIELARNSFSSLFRKNPHLGLRSTRPGDSIDSARNSPHLYPSRKQVSSSSKPTRFVPRFRRRQMGISQSHTSLTPKASPPKMELGLLRRARNLFTSATKVPPRKRDSLILPMDEGSPNAGRRRDLKSRTRRIWSHRKPFRSRTVLSRSSVSSGPRTMEQASSGTNKSSHFFKNGRTGESPSSTSRSLQDQEKAKLNSPSSPVQPSPELTTLGGEPSELVVSRWSSWSSTPSSSSTEERRGFFSLRGIRRGKGKMARPSLQVPRSNPGTAPFNGMGDVSDISPFREQEGGTGSEPTSARGGRWRAPWIRGTGEKKPGPDKGKGVERGEGGEGVRGEMTARGHLEKYE